METWKSIFIFRPDARDSFFSNMRRVRSSFKFQFFRENFFDIPLSSRQNDHFPSWILILFFKKTFVFLFLPLTNEERIGSKKKRFQDCCWNRLLHFHPLRRNILINYLPPPPSHPFPYQNLPYKTYRLNLNLNPNLPSPSQSPIQLSSTRTLQLSIPANLLSSIIHPPLTSFRARVVKPWHKHFLKSVVHQGSLASDLTRRQLSRLHAARKPSVYRVWGRERGDEGWGMDGWMEGEGEGGKRSDERKRRGVV